MCIGLGKEKKIQELQSRVMLLQFWIWTDWISDLLYRFLLLFIHDLFKQTACELAGISQISTKNKSKNKCKCEQICLPTSKNKPETVKNKCKCEQICLPTSKNKSKTVKNKSKIMLMEMHKREKTLHSGCRTQ